MPSQARKLYFAPDPSNPDRRFEVAVLTHDAGGCRLQVREASDTAVPGLAEGLAALVASELIGRLEVDPLPAGFAWGPWRTQSGDEYVLGLDMSRPGAVLVTMLLEGEGPR